MPILLENDMVHAHCFYNADFAYTISQFLLKASSNWNLNTTHEKIFIY